MKAKIQILSLGTLALSYGAFKHQQGRQRKRLQKTAQVGISETCELLLNGRPQVIHLRGKNPRHPLVLWLHGGPGMPAPSLTYRYEEILDREFTFCYWEQAGSGASYFLSSSKPPQLSFDQSLQDLDSLVHYLQARFKQEKIILVGHSFGSLLGALYSQQHPENLLTYIGVSQITDMIYSKYLILRMAQEEAEKRQDQKGLAHLRFARQKVERALITRLVKAEYYLKAEDLASHYLTSLTLWDKARTTWHFLTSPKLDWTNWAWLAFLVTHTKEFVKIQGPLMEEAHRLALKTPATYDIPVYFISSLGDWNAPYQQVQAYLEDIQAPYCQFTLLPGRSHSPFLDEPQVFAAFFRAWHQKLSTLGL